jgi:hypothetical protein
MYIQSTNNSQASCLFLAPLGQSLVIYITGLLSQEQRYTFSAQTALF